MNKNLEQHKMALHEYRQENSILRNILISRGIPFENELETRMASANMQSRSASNSDGPSSISPSAPYKTVIPTPMSTTDYAVMPEKTYANGESSSMAGPLSGATHYSRSGGPTSPLILEHAIKQEMEPISDMPGIFEKDPQLGIEFILS
jgi:hypothetical protein